MAHIKIKFMKQVMMRKVLYALMPIMIYGIGTFGWRVLALLIVSSISGILAEYAFKRKNNKPVSEAVFVTAMLYTLTLPPRAPFWVATLGMIFGVVFGKEVFGGFGRNVFNPALVGRAFVYVSFPKYLTTQWSAPADKMMGGFTQYITAPIDALASSTPMLIYRETGVMTDYSKLIIGNIPGSIGETSAILIILAAIYLIYTKTANWDTMAAVLLGYTLTSSTFYMMGVTQVPNPLWGAIAGGLLFGAVFMATDPITSPKTKEGRWIYGILIGIVTVIIRGFALFAGAIMFAILIGNTFAPIIDEGVKAYKAYGKKRGEVNG